VTLSELERNVRVRTRTHGGAAKVDFGGDPEAKSARAPAIPDDDHVRPYGAPSNSLVVVDDSALISEGAAAAAPRGSHLAEVGLAMTENFFTATPPATVADAWRGVAGDPGERRRRGLLAALFWVLGVVRALIVTALYAIALAVSTRARSAGFVTVIGLLVAVYFICHALLP
jgi:hypothetical protein